MLRRIIFVMVLFLAPILFLIGAVLPFVSDGTATVDSSRLIDFETELFFTIFSRVTMIVTIGYLGAVLYAMDESGKKMLGKSLYVLSFLFAFITVLMHFNHYSDQLEGSYEPALGLVVLFIAVVLGLVMAVVIVLSDVVQHWLEEKYGVSVQSTNGYNKDTTIFKELNKWKELREQELITEDDYNTIKEKRLEKITFKKMNSVEAVSALKKAYEDGLIAKNDFDTLKTNIIEALS